MLHRQNTLYNALGLPKECIIYRKHFKSKSDEYRCFKDNPLPVYELVLHTNCTVAHILEPQTFSNLHSAESEQLDWRKTGP